MKNILRRSISDEAMNKVKQTADCERCEKQSITERGKESKDDLVSTSEKKGRKDMTDRTNVNRSL